MDETGSMISFADSQKVEATVNKLKAEFEENARLVFGRFKRIEDDSFKESINKYVQGLCKTIGHSEEKQADFSSLRRISKGFRQRR